ncbi:MAG TPA: DoxX family protein [Acidimicrobiales bacterium]
MRAVASILTIILFLAFVTSGVQKLIFNTMASQTSEHLGFKKSSFQRLGILEILGAVGVMVGLAAKKASTLAFINVAAATGLFVMMVLATLLHLRRGDGLKGATPALILALVSLAELILRLV